MRRRTWLAAGWALLMGGVVAAEVVLYNVSTDQPLVLDQNTDYVLQNVMITGVADNAALTLTGRINSVSLRRCQVGKVRSGQSGRAVGVEAAGAMVGSFTATDSLFFDCENQLASLREGSFGRVTFERCTFQCSEQFLKEVYADNPWRDWPPVTEFHSIDTLELLDNRFVNTTVIIHPSVRKVIIRGQIPGLSIEDQDATQVILLDPVQGKGALATR